jgi:hypothetical protein
VKAWITAYALTRGIIEATGEISNTSSSMFVCDKAGYFKDNLFPYFHVEGREWHLTHESAIAKAEQMRQAKIKNLKKSIEKLELLKFV